MPTSSDLIDQIQIAIPRIQRCRVTAQQNVIDLDAALEALRQATVVLQATATRRVGHGTNSLHLALIEAGKTREQVSFLTGIARDRLDALCGGAEPTETERDTLRVTVPAWRG